MIIIIINSLVVKFLLFYYSVLIIQLDEKLESVFTVWRTYFRIFDYFVRIELHLPEDWFLQVLQFIKGK